MVFLKKYSNIKGFLNRFTIFKIGTFHVRIHRIIDKDQTELLHNHPFNYISIILKGGYNEIYIKNGTEQLSNHRLFSVIRRKHDVYHRIDSLKSETITLFIAYGKFNWMAISKGKSNIKNGTYQRIINDKKVYSKFEDGIWFIGNENKKVAEQENRHSIHQSALKIK